jgi:hypothetical protein
MLGNLGFQSVNQRLAFNSLKLLYKIENKLTPKYLEKLLKKNKEKYTYNLRRKSLYQIPTFRKNINQKSLFYKTLNIYNECKKDFAQSDFADLRGFCEKLNFFVKTKFPIRHQSVGDLT